MLATLQEPGNSTDHYLLQIVHNDTLPSEKLLKYKLDLEDLGALVKMVPAGDMGCVLKSQIVRVLAFLLPEVRYIVLKVEFRK